MKTIELIDAAKDKLRITKDSELALALGVGKSRIGHYRTGIRKPDERLCFQLAEILSLEPQAVISAVRAEGSSTPEEKTFWEGYAKRYGMMSLTSFIFAGVLTTTPQNGHSAPAYSKNSLPSYVLCAVRKWVLRFFGFVKDGNFHPALIDNGQSNPFFRGLPHGHTQANYTLD